MTELLTAVPLLKRIETRAPIDAAPLELLRSLRDDYGAISDTADGWRLRYQPEWWDAPTLRDLPGLSEAEIITVEETASTNDLAKTCPPGTIVLTEHQTRGRGQSQRRWWDLPGDAVMASVVLPRPSRIDGLSVAVGAMLWRYFGELSQLRLKWPNDLLNAQGEKIAGILVEAAQDKVIVGVGLNRAMPPALQATIARAGAAARAAGLHTALAPAPPRGRHECAAIIYRAICRAIRDIESGFRAFQEMALRAHIIKVGDPVSLKGEQSGRFAGFDEDGALLTREGNELRRHIGGAAERRRDERCG